MNTLIKWHKLSFNTKPRSISLRLSQIQKTRPKQVPILFQFGFTATGRLQLKTEKLAGLPLNQSWDTLSLFKKLEVKKRCSKVLELWKEQGFVHGDLSARNILITRKDHAPYFIDYALDLNSRSGTPLYLSSLSILKGGAPKTFHTDRQALQLIFESLSFTSN